jgi:3-methyl-2-oxobutanoate hydroxymethyltransferase
MHGDEVVGRRPAAVAGSHHPGTYTGLTAGSRVALDGKENLMGTQLTAPAVRVRKVRDGSEPLVMVTAYDAPGARMADEAGVDLILVGDSLAMVVLGYEDTLQVTIDDMVHHTAAVGRARTSALVVGDLPWLSYHVSVEDSVRNAAALVRAGAQAVKLEGGVKRLPMVEAILEAEIPVMGHLGLTPQSVHAMGGFKVQGRDTAAALALLDDAKALEATGCFSLVLEGVPDQVARMVTDAVSIPTIGIGAGPWCDGQVLVFHDVLGIEDRVTPKFVRRYASLKADGVAALSAFASDVRSGRFPSDAESYHLTGEAAEALALYGGGTNTA